MLNENKQLINTEKLNALYSEAYKAIPNTDNIVPFVFQFGPKYFSKTSSKILFVGKSVNGWKRTTKNPNDWFDLNFEKRLFMHDDQITWVLDLEGPNDEYNSKKSAFWRVIRKVTCEQIEKFHEIAWTNLYKFSPINGNPTPSLCRLQQSFAQEILFEEIEILKPKSIVFLTSGWEIPFLKGDMEIIHESITEWSGYRTHIGLWNNVKIITSVHPQGKPESIHADIIKNELAK